MAKNINGAFETANQSNSVDTPRRRLTSWVGRTACTITACLVAAGPAARLASAETADSAPAAFAADTVYHLDQMYINQDLIRQGYYLEGYNIAAPGYSEANKQNFRAVLWYQLLGNVVRRYNVAPESKNPICHYDEFNVTNGEGDTGVIYTSTHDACDKNHAVINSFNPGIELSPSSLTGQQINDGWSIQGQTSVAYSVFQPAQNKYVPVCAGELSYDTSVSASQDANGNPAIHTYTLERQIVSAVPGAPRSNACPPGPPTELGWEENTLLSPTVPYGRRVDGKFVATGMRPDLEATWGGSLNPDRDSSDSWNVIGNYILMPVVPKLPGSSNAK
jgi:hypothetical protein